MKTRESASPATASSGSGPASQQGDAWFRERAASSNWVLRDSVATRLACPPTILSQLTRDECWVVRASVARNPATPLGALLILMVDDEEYVREAAEHTIARVHSVPRASHIISR